MLAQQQDKEATVGSPLVPQSTRQGLVPQPATFNASFGTKTDGGVLAQSKANRRHTA